MKHDISYLGISEEGFFDYPEINTFELTNGKKDLPDKVGIQDKNSQDSVMTNSDYLVAFSTKSESYCVGIVDMVGSTKISASIGNARASRYYQIFLNSMAKIVNRFGGRVIKNVGDCLLFYFPESKNHNNKFGFMSSLECIIAMRDANKYICSKLASEQLPRVDYRISIDYGQTLIMRTNDSSNLDMIGPPVNMCAKINKLSPKNEGVIGGDLFEMVKKFKDYSFKLIGDYSLGFKQSYPVYTISRT